MSFETNVKQVISFEYDFAQDGGAVSSIDLREFAVNKLKAGLIVDEVVIHVETVVASGSGTATIGDGTDVDGFFLNLVALAAGSYNGINAARGGDLIVGKDTDSVAAKKPYIVTADSKPVLTVATGALTAGKFKIDFHCYARL